MATYKMYILTLLSNMMIIREMREAVIVVSMEGDATSPTTPSSEVSTEAAKTACIITLYTMMANTATAINPT